MLPVLSSHHGEFCNARSELLGTKGQVTSHALSCDWLGSLGELDKTPTRQRRHKGDRNKNATKLRSESLRRLLPMRLPV